MQERRKDSRTQTHVSVRVSGLDEFGNRFDQLATACNISAGGALLTGLKQGLRTRDLLIVGCGAHRARFRVVWVRDSETSRKIQAAVQRIKIDPCPWPELLVQTAAALPK